VYSVAQFNLERSDSSENAPWASEERQSSPQKGVAAGPRLVGGTHFHKHNGLDLGQIELLAEASLKSLEETKKVIVGWQRQGQSLADIYLNGVAQSARLLGERWLSDDMDFVDCTIAFSRLHRILHEFSAEFLQEACAAHNGLSVLLMTEPGTQHGFGVFMLSEFFRRAGWQVTLAAPQDMDDFKRSFQSDWFDAVCLSIATDRHWDDIAAAVPGLLQDSVNRHLSVYLGGPLAQTTTDLPAISGMHILSLDALKTVERVTADMVTFGRQFDLTQGPSVNREI
jgi:MerR family transcriptional regulator, light-induced transcriptional regulator